jgi:hypothetical protein
MRKQWRPARETCFEACLDSRPSSRARQTCRCAQTGLKPEPAMLERDCTRRNPVGRPCARRALLRIPRHCKREALKSGGTHIRRNRGKDEKSLRWPARLDQLDEAERATLTFTKPRQRSRRTCSFLSDESIPGVFPGRRLLQAKRTQPRKSFHQALDCNRQFISYDILCLFLGALDLAG